MGALQDKEFKTFGIVRDTMKAGVMMGLLTLSLTGNILAIVFIIKNQSELYEKMLARTDVQVKERVDEKLEKPLERLGKSNDQLDTVIAASAETNKVVDSAGKTILNKIKQ